MPGKPLKPGNSMSYNNICVYSMLGRLWNLNYHKGQKVPNTNISSIGKARTTGRTTADDMSYPIPTTHARRSCHVFATDTDACKHEVQKNVS